MCAYADTDTANRIATCSDSKRIRTRNARSIHRIEVDTLVFSSSVVWQRFEVVPNVIGPTSTTCERVTSASSSRCPLLCVLCLSFHNL